MRLFAEEHLFELVAVTELESPQGGQILQQAVEFLTLRLAYFVWVVQLVGLFSKLLVLLQIDHAENPRKKDRLI